ncbi:MAG: fatty acid desaturase family protein, partial [Bacteroidota bacterium]
HPFFDTLNERVEKYFTSKGISRTGNWKIYTKAGVLLTAIVLVYAGILLFQSWWTQMLFWSVLGMVFAAIGFNLMHDSAHGSFSSKSWVNQMMGYSLNIIGGNVFFWKIKHNQIHHVYTNVEGIDDDIDVQPFLRVNEQQKRYWFHKYQFIYWAVIYGLTYFLWVYVKDFSKYFTKKIGEIPIRKIPMSEHIIFWASKLLYLAVFVLVPLLVVGWLKTLVGYLVMLFVTGWIISVVFQLAHIVEGRSFHLPASEGRTLKDEWAIYQVNTTANFATKNKIVSWLTGGLNFQVEHHLFPRISHIHYPKINSIVRETCMEYGIAYQEYPNVLSAIRSHVSHLRILGAA